MGMHIALEGATGEHNSVFLLVKKDNKYDSLELKM